VRAFDKVFDSQRVFRCLLQATASPGKLFTLPPVGSEALEAVAIALLDHEVAFCAAGPRAGELEKRVSRTTGARAVPVPEADFALVSGGDSGGAVLDLKRGSLERPETGATAIYAVGRLSGAGPLTFELYGPGVPGTRTLGVADLSPAEARSIRENRSDYPLGVDVYLVDEAGRIASLPRSTRLEVIG
jgi:alpha-D-ribose 1-methylphosphonate 5-triphosphate synthase subunit PhnH